MGKVLYYLVLKPVSLLPLWVLYLISDVLFFFLYRVFGYRKTVVFNNLRNSFPDKSEAEIEKIAKAFYHHFSDLMIESIKVFSISREEVLRRQKVLNPELLDEIYKQGKSVIIVGGHYNNWEFLIAAFDSQIKHQSSGIYAPITNKIIQTKLNAARSKYGMELLAAPEVRDYFSATHNNPFAILILSDQSPPSAKRSYWTHFLNQDTAILFGTEKYATNYNLPVIFSHIRKVKRGYYETELEVVELNPAGTSHGEISEKHTRILEQHIFEKPEFWLWSHKRWKRKRTDP